MATPSDGFNICKYVWTPHGINLTRHREGSETTAAISISQFNNGPEITSGILPS